MVALEVSPLTPDSYDGADEPMVLASHKIRGSKVDVYKVFSMRDDIEDALERLSFWGRTQIFL